MGTEWKSTIIFERNCLTKRIKFYRLGWWTEKYAADKKDPALGGAGNLCYRCPLSSEGGKEESGAIVTRFYGNCEDSITESSGMSTAIVRNLATGESDPVRYARDQVDTEAAIDFRIVDAYPETSQAEQPSGFHVIIPPFLSWRHGSGSGRRLSEPSRQR